MKITESVIKKIVKESIDKVLSESDMYDYDANYEDLIRREYHNLCDLESKVPYSKRAEIHRLASALEGMLHDIRISNDIARV